MKKGDLVMFIDEGTYAKWFYGQMAEVINYTIRDRDGACLLYTSPSPRDS